VSHWSANEGMVTDVDLSQLTFTVEDETSTEAHVRVGGTYSYMHQGQSQTYTYYDSGPHNDLNVHTVEASGLGWCLTTDILAPDLVTGQADPESRERSA
jgi:hypothetical protein